MPRGRRPEPVEKAEPEQNASHRVDMRLTHLDAKRIEESVNRGHFLSKADFARTAVREKLGAIPEPAAAKRSNP